jgi:hypothetical protein
MSYTIDFAGHADPVAKRDAAVNAAKAYLGDRYTGIINAVTQAIDAGELTTRKQVHLAMSFAGIQGYPVDALTDTYWPSLPA